MKPHVICLMASSVDGRTLHSRWRPKGSAGDLFERVHDELAGDAWLVGRVTGQEFAKGKPYPAVDERDLSARALVRATRREGLWRRARRSRQDRLGPFGHRWRSDRRRPVRGGFGCASGRAARRGRVLHLCRKVGTRSRPRAGHPQSRTRREAAAAGGRRRCQRCLSARGIGRRTQFDPVSGRGRRKGCTERIRLHGCGGRSPSPRHGDDAGEQSGLGRRRNVAAVPDPERGYSSCGQ